MSSKTDKMATVKATNERETQTLSDMSGAVHSDSVSECGQMLIYTLFTPVIFKHSLLFFFLKYLNCFV